jgi:hypothetical protein
MQTCRFSATFAAAELALARQIAGAAYLPSPASGVEYTGAGDEFGKVVRAVGLEPT